MKFTALVAIIDDKDEEKAIDVAKEAGAGGVTIIHGKNIGFLWFNLRRECFRTFVCITTKTFYESYESNSC